LDVYKCDGCEQSFCNLLKSEHLECPFDFERVRSDEKNCETAKKQHIDDSKVCLLETTRMPRKRERRRYYALPSQEETA
jgi:hypothetical protein